MEVKVELWRCKSIDAFELCCWKRPREYHRSQENKQVVDWGNPNELSFEAQMMGLKLSSFGDIIWRPSSIEKMLMLEKIDGKIGREDQQQGDGLSYSDDGCCHWKS